MAKIVYHFCSYTRSSQFRGLLFLVLSTCIFLIYAQSPVFAADSSQDWLVPASFPIATGATTQAIPAVDGDTYSRPGANSNDLYGLRGSYSSCIWWSSERLVYSGALYDSKPSIVNLGNNEMLCAFFSGRDWSADRNTWLSRDIFAVRSLDGGWTWQNQSPITVYQGTGSADFWPSLLKLSNGNLICAFTTSEEGSVDQLNIKMVSSTDHGYSWGDEETISMQTHPESWPALAQRADGSVICVWDSDPGEVSSIYYLYSSKLLLFN